MIDLLERISRPEHLERLERTLGRLLSAGAVLSAALLATGLVGWLIGGDSPAAFLLLHAGLMVLMGTPVLRVVVSCIEFVRTRDWFYVLVTLLVLGIVTTSIVLALEPR